MTDFVSALQAARAEVAALREQLAAADEAFMQQTQKAAHYGVALGATELQLEAAAAHVRVLRERAATVLREHARLFPQHTCICCDELQVALDATAPAEEK